MQDYTVGWYNYLFGWRNFDIRTRDVVLEVGSGHRPLVRSDILCDKFPFSSYERGDHLPVTIDRPFVVADAMCLPFKDQSVDFVYCADLAEHLDQPDRFFDECMRVGKRGVIITPSMLAEQLLGWDFHAVMFEKKGDGLVIHRKTEGNWRWFGDTFHRIWLKDKYFSQFYAYYPDLFRLVYVWDKQIRYEFAPIEDGESLWTRLGSDQEMAEAPLTVRKQIMRRLRSLASRLLRQTLLMRKDVEIQPLVCCPECHGELMWGEIQIRCASCQRLYPVTKGLPFLVTDH